MEIFKEGKALPRWVENVLITASKIKGCSIDDDENNENEEHDVVTSSPASSSSNPASSSSADQLNGHPSTTRGGNRKLY